MKLYLAGPMSNIPQFNIPLFILVAEVLRAAGHSVISPVELDSPEIRAEALASPDGKMGEQIGGETWGQILARDVIVVADQVDGIALLPRWLASRGARLEVLAGLLCRKEFYVWVPATGTIAHVTRNDIARSLAGSIIKDYGYPT